MRWQERGAIALCAQSSQEEPGPHPEGKSRTSRLVRISVYIELPATSCGVGEIGKGQFSPTARSSAPQRKHFPSCRQFFSCAMAIEVSRDPARKRPQLELWGKRPSLPAARPTQRKEERDS
jgi:hypothetical protein